MGITTRSVINLVLFAYFGKNYDYAIEKYSNQETLTEVISLCLACAFVRGRMSDNGANFMGVR